MSRRLSFELVLAVLMVGALIAADWLLDYGLLRELHERPTWNSVLGLGVCVFFVVGIWFLFSEPDYRYVRGDRVHAGMGYGAGTVVYCSREQQCAVYEVDLDSGHTVAFGEDELTPLPAVKPEGRRPWYRPQRGQS